MEKVLDKKAKAEWHNRIRYAIIKQIKEHCSKTFPSSAMADWYIGITNNPRRRKWQHSRDRKIRKFRAWNAQTLINAHIVEQYYGMNGKGMRGGGTRGNVASDSRYVYVFST